MHAETKRYLIVESQFIEQIRSRYQNGESSLQAVLFLPQKPERRVNNMPSNMQALAQMADHTATQITASHTNWTDFLKTAARLYKYPYHEQLMIYAQRPEATACADHLEFHVP